MELSDSQKFFLTYAAAVGCLTAIILFLFETFKVPVPIPDEIWAFTFLEHCSNGWRHIKVESLERDLTRLEAEQPKYKNAIDQVRRAIKMRHRPLYSGGQYDYHRELLHNIAETDIEHLKKLLKEILSIPKDEEVEYWLKKLEISLLTF